MDLNPYAAPQPREPAPASDVASTVLAVEGVWRDNGLLVANPHVRLPNICIKTNQPCDGRKLKVELVCQPAFVSWLQLIPMRHVLASETYSKRVTLLLPLGDAWWQRRLRAKILGSIVIGLGVVVGLGGLALSTNTSVGLYLIGFPLGLVVIVFVAVVAMTDHQVVKAVKMERGHVWLEGVHPDLVAALPDFASRRNPRVEL